MKTGTFRLLGITALSATFFLSACGDTAPSEEGSSSNPQAGETTETLKKIKEEGEIVVGVKYDTPPFGFVPEGQSDPAGFDIDLVKEFAKELGVDIDFVQVTTKNRTPNLQTGKIDMIMASMVRTPEREEVIDFSIDYFSDDQTLLVPADSAIQGLDDLADKTVALAQGGFEEENLREAAPQGVEVLAYQGWPQALQAMIRGEADAVTSTVGLLSGLADSARDAGVDVKTVGETFAEGPVGAGFRKGDDELRQEFNKELAEMVEDGTYDEISNKWWAEVRSEPYEVDTSSVDQ